MNILVYADSGNQTVNDHLLRIIESKVSREYIESVKHIELLTKRVRRLLKGIDIAILLAKDKEQLCELISLKVFLEDIPIIVILPDLEKEIISMATKLYPSLISSVDSDFYFVSDVLENMLKIREKRFSIKRG
jgi:hypothetical protein